MRQRLVPFVGSVVVVALHVSAPAAEGALRMFLTSATHNGDFDGIAGADAFCQSLADNTTPPLGGTYRAWLSTDADDAYCRVAGFTGKYSANCGQAQLPNPGPYQRIDGLPFVRSLQELTVLHRILTTGVIDENGNEVLPTMPPSVPFTGTNFGGLYDGFGTTCTNWDSNTGFVTFGSQYAGPFFWTEIGTSNLCAENHRLYCFETGPATPLPTFEYDGALAFISSTPHDGDFNGIAGADVLCQERAAAAFLPNSETFFAWLSDAGINAIDRLTHTGAFKRVDGVPIAVDKADLVDAAGPLAVGLIAGLWKSEADTSNFFFAWTGTAVNGTATANTCNNWDSNQNADTGDFGYGYSMLGNWTNDAPTTFTCNSANYYYYCFSNVPILFWDNFENLPYFQRWSSVAP